MLEPEGAFRKKHLSMTALVPGLAVEAKGSFNDKHQLVADPSRSMAQTSRPHKTSRLAWLRHSSRFSRISSKFKLTNRRFSSSNKSFKKKRQRPPPTKQRLQLPINVSENLVTTIF